MLSAILLNIDIFYHTRILIVFYVFVLFYTLECLLLQVTNIDAVLGLIGVRFGNMLRYLELPCELTTAPTLHELANKCPNLKNMTLDFSNAMQLHDFNDMNAFPCNLRSLTICLSEVIFMEGFMRKVYQSLSCLEVLHLIGEYVHGSQEAIIK